jgi:hypothetical protein
MNKIIFTTITNSIFIDILFLYFGLTKEEEEENKNYKKNNFLNNNSF